MDIFEYRVSHKLNLEGTFNTQREPSDDLGGLFLRLKNLLTTELHTQWDLAFFEKYILEGMVPRSLRWEVAPQSDITDHVEWFQFFNNAGINLMNFMTTKKRAKLTAIDTEISAIKEKLIPFKEKDEYIKHSDSLKKHLNKEEIEQRNKKRKKFLRDFGDYQTGVIFKWQRKDNSIPEQVVQSAEATPTTDIEDISDPPQQSVPTNVQPAVSEGWLTQGRGRGRGGGRGKRGGRPRPYVGNQPIATHNRFDHLGEVDDHRYIVQHPGRQGHQGYDDRGTPYDSFFRGQPTYFSPRRDAPVREQQYSDPRNHRDFPVATPRGKKQKNPREGPEGGGGSARKKQRR